MWKVYRQWLEMITWTFGPGELKIRKIIKKTKNPDELCGQWASWFNSYVGIGMPIILKYVYNTTKHV